MSHSNWDKKWLFHEPERKRSLPRGAWWGVVAVLSGLVLLAHTSAGSLL